MQHGEHMSILDRQRAIQRADSALREVDLPLYADVVVALHRLQNAVEEQARSWQGRPLNAQARRALHYAAEAKELIACFQESPLAYERRRQQARQQMLQLIEAARQTRPGDDIDDIQF